MIEMDLKKFVTTILQEELGEYFISVEFFGPYEDEDIDGNTVIKYDYFGDFRLEEQIDFCNVNEYLFNEYGEPIHQLIIN